LTSVCEITSASGSGAGACGQSNPQTGLLTKYTYDALGNLLTVTQNAQPGAIGGTQTRTYAYDGLSRLTSETNPESGTTSYFYDSPPSTPGVACPGPYNGDLVKRYDANGNTACYAYDALHRVTSTTYSGPNTTTNRYFVYDAATVDGQPMAYAKGRLAEGYTATSQSGTKVTDEGFSYTPRGELTNFYESTPHSAGYYSVPITYWANGLVETFGPFLTYRSLGYNPDGEGRAYSLQFADWLASTTYNAAGQPTQLMTPCASGTCYPISYQYDPNTLRMTQYSYALSGGTVSGSLTWNPNGSLQQLVVADPFNSADAQTCNYSADDLVRISSVSCNSGSVWGQQFTYDAFGNLTKSVPSGATGITWQPGYSSSTNRYTLGGTSYDANGNVLKDTFNIYTWDAEGKNLSTAYDNGGGETSTFTYDAFGHKVESSTNGNYQVSYVTLGNYKLSATGQTANYSLYPLPGGSFISVGGGWTGVQMADWLGTIRAVASDSGTEVQTGAHAPFGEEYSFTTQYPKPSIFTGQLDDGNDNPTMYYFQERQYPSSQGRWLSPDPAGLGAADPTNPQSWNRYAYVLNNPLSNIDPLGLDCARLQDDGTAQVYTDEQDDCRGDNGYYFDGTVDRNSVEFNVNGDILANVDGNTQCSGECNTEVANVNDQPGTLLQYLTSTVPIYVPNDTPLSPSGRAAALAIHNALFNAPEVCSAEVQVSTSVKNYTVSAAGSLGPNGAQGQLSAQLPFIGSHSVGSVEPQAQATPVVPVPSWSPVDSPANAQVNGRNVVSVSAQASFGVKKLNVTVSGYANLSNQNCP
jgi:RHS repeat-associated protein